MAPPRTATRPSLSREVVADRALAVADAEGLDAVTIRRLAGDLGVTPMALYWHFRTKDDLLAGVADRLLDAVRMPEATGDWGADLRALLLALLDATRPHPHVAGLLMTRMLVHPTGLDVTELGLGLLSTAGFGPETAADLASQGLRTVVSLVTSDRVGRPGDPLDDALLRQKQAALAALPRDRYPHLVRSAVPMTCCDDPDDLFGLGVDLFVEGVRGLARRGA